MAISCLFLDITTGPDGSTSRQVTTVPSQIPKRITCDLIKSSGRYIILIFWPLLALSSVTKSPPIMITIINAIKKGAVYNN